MLDTIIYIPTILAYAFITLLVVILSFIVVYVSHKIYISVYDNLPVPVLESSSLLDQTSSTEKNEAVVFEQTSTNSILAKQAQIVRKSKSALKIIVTLQPCYLAYVVFETRKTANIIVPAATAAQLTAADTASGTVTAPPTSTAIVSATPTTMTVTSTQTMSTSCECIECNGDNPNNITDSNINNNNHNHRRSSQQLLEATNTLLGINKYIKYYDRLSAIPHGKVMQTCPNPTIEITRSSREIRRPDLVLLSNVYDSIANRRTRMNSN